MAFMNKHSKLLGDERVSEWYTKSRQRSQLNADVNLRNLGLFCERMKTNPVEVLELAKNGALKKKFKDYVNLMEKEGKAGSYIVKYKTVLNHWIKYNDIDFKIDEKIFESDKYRTVFHEHVPVQSELRSIILNATKRGRVSIALMAFSGLRPESIGNYEGNDGVRLRDIEGLDLKKLEFTVSPTMVTVRDNLSKTRDEYFSLIGDEGMQYVLDYLKERIKEGELLSEGSPLLAFRWGKDTRRLMPRTLLVTREVRDAMRESGFTGMRPYVLRRYFASALSIGETKGLITHEWRQFIMGHKGDMESVYVNAKGNLNDELKSTVRDSYKKCLEYIETGAKSMSEEDREKDFRLRLLRMEGFTQEEIDAEGLLDLGGEELLQKRRQKLFGSKDPQKDARESARLDRQVMNKLRNGSRQKVISAYAIEAYIAEGFEFISPIPGDKAVVRLP